jgi:hypothetical protein
MEVDSNFNRSDSKSGCSLSDELQQVSGREHAAPGRASTVQIDASATGKGEQPEIWGCDAGLSEAQLQSFNTPLRTSRGSSVAGAAGAGLGPLQPEGSDATNETQHEC